MDSEYGRARRCQLDRQRDTVKAPADSRDHRDRARVRHKMRLCSPYPLDEQPNSALLQEIVDRRDILRWHGEGLDWIDPFAPCS